MSSNLTTAWQLILQNILEMFAASRSEEVWLLRMLMLSWAEGSSIWDNDHENLRGPPQCGKLGSTSGFFKVDFNPLIRPYFRGGWHWWEWGFTLNSHEMTPDLVPPETQWVFHFAGLRNGEITWYESWKLRRFVYISTKTILTKMYPLVN